MKKMKHPNILEIDFIIKSKYEIFLILPFIEGGDLKKFYQQIKTNNNKLSEEQILFIAI